jgi:hypothetical protein
MAQKLTIFLFLLSCASFAYAQEEDPIIPVENRTREVVIENEGESFPLPAKSDQEVENNNKLKLPAGVKFNRQMIPAGENNNPEETQAEEPKKLAYNFLYYIFYKFRKVESEDE